MDLKQQLGKRIKELRVKNGLTQAALAEHINIAVKHQSCVENGKNYPSSELIEKYAKAFKMEPCEILYIPKVRSKEEMIKKITATLQRSSIDKIKLIFNILEG